MTRRRILLSSFACSPEWGSEPGVGWRWLVELTQRHDVVLITHRYFRLHLEPLLRERPLAGLEIHYFAPTALGAHPHRQLNSRLFYIWWQWRARSLVKSLLKTEHFDLIHHLTWGTMRFPTFLGHLGVPLMMGPLGGGEVAPMRLFEGSPLRERLFEWVRSATLWWSRIDPLAVRGPKASVLVLCKTGDTLSALPKSVRTRAVVAPEIGAPPVDLRARKSAANTRGPYRLLFAGRLVGWKGVLLALDTARLLVQSGHDIFLDIAGDGPLRALLERHVLRQDLSARVHLLGKLPRESLLELYGAADLFIFPSLHDSSGNVVLEALSRGLPVICLDLGGPKHYVTPECGVVVSTQARSRAEVARAMAAAIAEILDRPDRLAAMTRAAAKQATTQTWAVRVAVAYDLIDRRLNWSPTA
jgi:glycosyltransferase involved in cell wall biosynthesis